MGDLRVSRAAAFGIALGAACANEASTVMTVSMSGRGIVRFGQLDGTASRAPCVWNSTETCRVVLGQAEAGLAMTAEPVPGWGFAGWDAPRDQGTPVCRSRDARIELPAPVGNWRCTAHFLPRVEGSEELRIPISVEATEAQGTFKLTPRIPRLPNFELRWSADLQGRSPEVTPERPTRYALEVRVGGQVFGRGEVWVGPGGIVPDPDEPELVAVQWGVVGPGRATLTVDGTDVACEVARCSQTVAPGARIELRAEATAGADVGLIGWESLEGQDCPFEGSTSSPARTASGDPWYAVGSTPFGCAARFEEASIDCSNFEPDQVELWIEGSGETMLPVTSLPEDPHPADSSASTHTVPDVDATRLEITGLPNPPIGVQTRLEVASYDANRDPGDPYDWQRYPGSGCGGQVTACSFELLPMLRPPFDWFFVQLRATVEYCGTELTLGPLYDSAGRETYLVAP
jgi:hypothetical protein